MSPVSPQDGSGSPVDPVPGADADLSAGRPLLSIVSGRPSPEETAAVAVVLSLVTSPAAPPAAARPATSEWAARSRFLRPPLTPGPGAWRASGLPR